MSIEIKSLRPAPRARGASLVAIAVAAVLSACTVQERVYVPPPHVYVPPPPAATVEVDEGGVELTATEAPPPLPDYEQPPCPEEGYLWTPGYWSWGSGGYFWVPGTWVQPPRVGVLWTPGYWGFAGGVYGFHAGYWGPHIGFYGGVNYGFGYGGVGYAGGAWEGGHFSYNRAVTNVNVTVIHNTYNQTVVNNTTINNRTSFNGGTGGIQARPTPQERAVAAEPHIPPTPTQVQHRTQAASNPALAVKNNGGHPAIAATPKPGQFSGPGVVGAHGAGSPPPHAAAAAVGAPQGGPQGGPHNTGVGAGGGQRSNLPPANANHAPPGAGANSPPPMGPKPQPQVKAPAPPKPQPKRPAENHNENHKEERPR